MRYTRSIYALLVMTIACLCTLFAISEAEASRSIEGTVPQAASAMGRQIDRQILERLGHSGGIALTITVPVNLNDLDESNPLARQMAEELARWFTQAGYNVQEMRKGRMILVEPGNGEKLLTRRVNLLSHRTITGSTIMTGTYTVTGKNVRFNIRILDAGSQNVLGMATVSVPISGEVRSLLGTAGQHTSYAATSGPSTSTSFP